MKRTSKSTKNVKTRTHFEMGVACLKNSILMGSKDSIKREKKKPNLELAEHEEEKKMKGLTSWDLQEKGDNRKLGRRGRRR